MKYYLLVFAILLTGCGGPWWKPYDVPEFHEVGSSHTAFLLPLEGNTEKQAAFDSEDFLKKSMVATKRVQITHKWLQTGYYSNQGEWVPTERLVTVDRAPVTRAWSADTKTGTSTANEAIWFESKDSVGVSTGFTCTARIKDNEAAAKFLYNYPAASSSQKDRKGGHIAVSGKGLAAVMDTEVRAQVQSRVSEFGLLYP